MVFDEGGQLKESQNQWQEKKILTLTDKLKKGIDSNKLFKQNYRMYIWSGDMEREEIY